MKKHKNKLDKGRTFRLVLLGSAALCILIAELLYGADVTLLNPKGFIAHEQFKLILITAAILLTIGIPALFFFYYFAWKYRDTNDKAAYDPDVRPSKAMLIGFWAVPGIIALVLTPIMFTATHRLEPKDPIAADAKPLTVQVVALRWKWLFIYPEQNIATVNFVQIPTGTPVHFDLTADETPMSSFWIPHLGGQLYAMTGHANRLNLIADKPGDYDGSSAEINGSGFASMKFTARAGSQAEFDSWVRDVQLSQDELDADGYDKLLQPSEKHPTAYYSLADPSLYGKVLMKYMGSHEQHVGEGAVGHPKSDQHDNKNHTGPGPGH